MFTDCLLSFEDRQDLLGHRSGRITSHYSAAELTNLIRAANQVVGQGSRKSPALVMLRKKAANALAVTASHFCEKMARPERFELPTAWFVARYSIQLSYGRVVCLLVAEREGFEPSVQLYTVQRFSKPPLSTTQPSLRSIVPPPEPGCGPDILLSV